ncbi:LPD38 domain-containing protein [uncultured Oscillibacter sp.]|uniref:LPD38 domain-containing protein n=1 Tax=uncultured Oscillibacter sp. TaxID=876091 RepID=UPI0025DB42D8|nr:LPD38 domain-containing protein [uncultured Oscillibacter sp.]
MAAYKKPNFLASNGNIEKPNFLAENNNKAGTQNASLPVSNTETVEQIIERNRIAAQKTGAPVLGETSNTASRRAAAKSSWKKHSHAIAKEPKNEDDFSAAKLAGGIATKGIDSAMSGLTSTADWLVGQNITGLGDILGQDWSNNPVSALNRRVQQAKETNQAYFQPNVEQGGKAAEIVDKYGTATVAAVPQALTAVATAGMSAAGTAGLQAASAAAQSSGAIAAARGMVQSLAKDPQYWLAFSQVAGDSYQQAKADGAGETAANLYAMGNGLLNAAIEVGGGIQTLPKELQKGGSALKAWVNSMLDEGKEEVAQGIMERGLQNLMYQKGNPLASVKDENAVLNPRTAAEEFAGGAVVGGILGGGQTLINRAANVPNAKLMKDGVKLEGAQKSTAPILETVSFDDPKAADGKGAVSLLRESVRDMVGVEPVANISGTEIPSEGRATDRVMDFVKSLKDKVIRPNFGEVLFSKSKVKNSLVGHGSGEAKIELFAAVPAVIQQGKQIAHRTNWKGRGYDSFVFAAPVTYRGETTYVTAIVVRDNANRYYLHEAVDQYGNLIYGHEKSPDAASDGSGVSSKSTVADTELSPDSISRSGENSKGDFTANVDEETMQTIQNSNLPTVMKDDLIQANHLVAKEKARKAAEQETRKEIEMPRLETAEQGVLRKDTELPGGSYVSADEEGYMDALSRSENEPGERMTERDYAKAAADNRLKKMEAPPESTKESVDQADLDELWKLWGDQANPVTSSEDRRAEALARASAMIVDDSKPEKQTMRRAAAETRSYFMRKMVDAGDSVTKIQKLTRDQYLYDFYNMARASSSAGINMINGEQTDISGKHVGESLNAILDPIRGKGKEYYNAFNDFMQHLHNIDRMSIESKGMIAQQKAELALAEFDRENPDIATVTEARLKQKSESMEENAELARERLELLRKVNQADQMKNKPVFGYDVTADMSRDTAARLLHEHPEFAEYQEQVRGYIKNLMQYRVDSGLMTPANAAFLEEYYPNYVPTLRKTKAEENRSALKSVKIGKTVGRAEGGNEKLLPLHETLGKQTMAVVREGSKNRFGQRLLEARDKVPQKVGQYISDVQKYEAGFSLDTFDSMEADPAFLKNNTAFVYKDGKLMELAVDPSLFEAMKALSPDKKETNLLVQGIRAGNKLFKALVTGYNPTFTVRNTVRDLQTAGLYSRDLTAFTKNYPKALQEIASDGQYWKRYKALGGSFSSVFDYQTGTVKESSKAVQKTLGRVEAMNMAMEQAPRLAEFMSIVKKGDGSMENLMDAMHAAADVTVNFGRAGTLGKILNANYIPFLNPGIQGFDRMVRRATETKGAKEWAKLAVRAVALGVAPALLNALLYQGDDDWDDLKASDKDTNYLFKIGDGLWLKLPKGRELSVLGMTGQRIGDLLKGEDVDWKEFFATVGNQVAPANPLNQNILKAFIDSDLLDSKSPGKTWYGGDIENQRLQSYAPGERYDTSTDVFSRWVGKQLNLSPKKINYLLDQYSGVVGDFMLPLLTPQAERDAFSKAFTVDSVSSNRISGDFYDKGDEITYEKNGGDVSMQVVGRFWSKQVSACSDIYAKIRNIESSETLTDAQKREKVREAKAVLNGIQKNALGTVEVYQDAVKKYLKGTSDDAVDTAYREANRECFGAEYALQVYNKDVYEKAQAANRGGVSYSDFYDYYFATKKYESKDGKSTTTQKLEYLNNAGFSDSTKAELYFADLASDSDLLKQAELETSVGITPVQYWEYKASTAGIKADTDAAGKSISGSKKEKVLDAIHKLDLTVKQKDALYYANGWSANTLSEAPWYDIMPRLNGRRQTSGSGGGKTGTALDKYSLGKYSLDKYNIMPKLR